jgi:hypothetical protein
MTISGRFPPLELSTQGPATDAACFSILVRDQAPVIRIAQRNARVPGAETLSQDAVIRGSRPWVRDYTLALSVRLKLPDR